METELDIFHLLKSLEDKGGSWRLGRDKNHTWFELIIPGAKGPIHSYERGPSNKLSETLFRALGKAGEKK